MTFDPNKEPCFLCGREADECVCALAPDIPDDFGEDLEEWSGDDSLYEEEE